MANNPIADNIILGCLSTKPMSGYAIKQMIDNSTAQFYNASYGSIYPTLKRHEDNGLVSSRETVEGGRYQKIYEITPAGRAVFMDWLHEAPKPIVVKYEMLVRLFFFENLKPAEQQRQLLGHLEQVRAAQQELRAIEPIAREEDPYKQLTWQWGDEFYSFLIQWYEKLLRQLKDRGMNE